MSRTLENAANAFVGESQARNRYTFYAAAARKEGHESAAELFLALAEQERVHAGVLYRMLSAIIKRKGYKGPLKTVADVPVAFGSTAENIEASMKGEGHEHLDMYPAFAEEAAAEGESEAEVRFRSLAAAEHHHEERLRAELEKLKGGSAGRKAQDADEWVCRKCGYPHKGDKAPDVCPLCGHPESYFEKH